MRTDGGRIFSQQGKRPPPLRRKHSRDNLLIEDEEGKEREREREREEHEQDPRNKEQGHYKADRDYEDDGDQGRVQPTGITYDLDYRSPAELTNSDRFPRWLAGLGACCIPCKMVWPCCFCSWCPCSTSPVFQQEMQSLGLLQEWGRFTRVLQPGLHLLNPISQSVVEVSQQTQYLQYRQVCISRDGVQFEALLGIFYRFVDSLKVAYRLGDRNADDCLVEMASGTLRSVVGQNVLQSIIESRSLVCTRVTRQLNHLLDYWGIHIEITSIKEMQVDPLTEKALETVAIAKRTTQAMLVAYRAEVSIAKLWEEVWERASSEAAFQIRYLNAVDGIIRESARVTIILSTSLGESLP